MSDEEIDRSELEAGAQVLPERELMSLISPDSGVDALPVPGNDAVESSPAADEAADTADNDAEGPEAGGGEQISPGDSGTASS